MVVSTKYVSPYFLDGVTFSKNITSRFPPEIATSMKDLVLRILFHPPTQLRLLKERVLDPKAIIYLIFLLAPFLMLYKRPWWILAAAPILGMNVLSYNNHQRLMMFHYDILIVIIFY